MSTIFKLPERPIQLSTTFETRKLEEVSGLWSSPEFVRAPLSVDGSLATTATENRMLNRSEPSFITNSSSYLFEQAHWINAVRGTTPAHKQRKRAVEFLLQLQGITTTDFDLEGPSNRTNLEPLLHSGMDKFSMFAVTCTHKTLDKMIAVVEAQNTLVATQKIFRQLQIEAFSTNAEYELVVLHPKQFLPNNSRLYRYPSQASTGDTEMESHDAETGSTDTEMEPTDEEIEPTAYRIDGNGVLRQTPITPESPRFPSFRFHGIRQATEGLNPYLVILAAHIKFRRYRKAPSCVPLDPEYERLVDKTIKLANLLYWHPNPDSLAREVFYLLPEEVKTVVEIKDHATGSENAQGEREDATIPQGGGPTAQPPVGQNYNWQFDLLAGIGHEPPLDDDDRALLREMEGPVPYASKVGSWVQEVG